MPKQHKIKPVLFISDNFPPVIGGSSTVYDQICKNNADKIVALSSRTTPQGFEKTEIEHYDQTCGYLMYRINQLRVPHNNSQTNTTAFMSVASEISLMLKVMLKITQLCFKHKVKTICVGELVYGGWIVLFSRYLLGKKTILYTHGEEISQESGGLYNKYRGVFLRSAHKIISVSLFCKSQIVSLYHVSPGKIEIISNGVDTQRFKPGPRDHALLETHDIKKTDKVILSVGRLVKRKGHHNLILAMQQIVQQTANAKLIIIGSGEEQLNLINLSQQLKLDQAITFLNNIDDEKLIHYYQSADIFTMPNITLEDGDTEGFGLVFLEANACAKPVVGGQAGGAIEAIIHNKTGLLVDGYNVAEIAQSIQRIINDAPLHKNLSKQAYEYVQSATWQQKSKIFSHIIAKIQTQKDSQAIIPFTTSTPVTLNTNNPQKRLHITIDFEEMFDWSDLSKGGATVQGIKEIQAFHNSCLSHQIQPTYLVTHSVLQSDTAVNFLKNIYTGNHEIGIHLHPWNSPPFIEQINTFNSFQCNLPNYLEKLKIDELIQLFEQKLGFKPLIHRAGRYGCSQQTLNHLKAHNIKIDLSPSAGYNFNTQGGPDFSKTKNAPFWSDKNKDLLCLPIPSINFLKGPDYLTKLYKEILANNHLLHIFSNPLLPSTPVRLSPEANSLERMKLIGSLLDKQGITDFILSVHSTSLYAGGNEYSLTEQDAQNNIDKIIEYTLWSNKYLNTNSATTIDSYNQYS